MAGSARFPSEDSVTAQLVRWLLLSGDRFAVTAGLTLGVFGFFTILGLFGIITIPPSKMQWFLNGTINGLLTLIPVAVGINQIVLTQELESLNNMHDRTKGTYAFRDHVADTLDTAVSSPRVGEFCNDLITGINDRATQLNEACDDSTAKQLSDDVDDYTRAITTQTEIASAALSDDSGVFDSLSILLDFYNTWQVYTTQRLQATHNDALPETARSALTDLEELLLETDTTIDYLKTLWVQRELSEFSRMLLYSGIPAVLIASIGIFGYRNVAIFGTQTISDMSLSQPPIVVVTSALVALSLLPLWLLISYMVRVALVVQRTAAAGPFVSQPNQQRLRGEGVADSKELDAE